MELNYIRFTALLMSYSAVPLNVTEPTHTVCTLKAMLFTVSFNISYLIMLIKAIRIYRIFRSPLTNFKLSYISSTFHITITLGFFVEEVIRFLLLARFVLIKSLLHQPQVQVRYVEKFCMTPNIHMSTFVITDLLFHIVSSVFAFKTRTLPNRFKESRFISTCVLTTLIMWCAFLPAYLTTMKMRTRALYLVTAILINSYTILLLLLIPRLLLAEFLSEKHGLLYKLSAFCFKNHNYREIELQC
ncbi:metabotropic glutamate receptor 2 [Biomphalaria glabrata]|nr:metabotropic glutamate receptor 2-like [Biomphalaria glabrata]